MATPTLAQFQAEASPSDWALSTQYANQFNIPPNILQAVVAKESSWNPNAASSSSTSVGYGQLTAGTASDLGVDASNPQQNLFGTAKYLSEMYTKFGNWAQALAAYNQGPNATSPTALAAGANYASSVMAIANTAPVVDTSAAPGWIGVILTWLNSKLATVLFVLIGGALIVIALLHNDTVRNAATETVKTAAVA